MEIARRKPGQLMKETLEKMSSYVTARLGDDEDSGKLKAVAQAYLQSVLLPATGGNMGLRSTRELQTLAKALDLVVKGKLAEAADVVAQRFKAVEAAHHDGWDMARHVELLPPTSVSAMPEQERERAAKERKKELQIASMVKGG